MEKIGIQFTLFSAFYSPLIVTIAGDFLMDEGLDADWSVAPPGVSAIKALTEGDVQVIQTAPSQAFTSLNKGETPVAIHFAQVNEMDGFFVTGRDADPDFRWEKLEGADVVLFGGGQPLAMFKYACHKAGIDFDRLNVVSPGSAADMDTAFRDGQGDYIQQQGPFPQQLEKDGVGHIVAQCGPLIGPNAFSSLASTRDWLTTDAAKAFTRAYRNARGYLHTSPASEVTALIKPFFPKNDPDVLEACISAYKALGCWTPHVEITPEALDVALDVFEYNGLLKARYAYDQVCAPPPV